jgi:hypothetical protein
VISHGSLRLIVVLSAIVLAPTIARAAEPDHSGPSTLNRPDTGAVGGPSPDEWENGLGNKFEDLIRHTGALGFFIRDGTVVVVVPSSGSSTFSAADAKALGISVIVEERDMEPDDIRAIVEMVAARDWRPQTSNVFEPVALFDPPSGKVRIYTDAPVTEFRGVLDRFGSKVRYVGRPFVDFSRRDDVEPHWGGARIKSSTTPSGFYCTSGFSVTLNVSGNPRMVTAGHCWAQGADVYSPQGTSFGIVKDRSAYPSEVDAELIGASTVSMGPSIYVGDETGTQAAVLSAGDPGLGTEYCHSGATTYERCGAYVTSLTIFYVNGSPVLSVRYPCGNSSAPGDSGAPFYRWTYGGVQIRAIVKGGETVCDEVDGRYQYAFISIYSWIQEAYGVTVRTV